MKFVKEMKDLEAVEYCITMGIEEAESLRETYNRRNRFDNMKSVISLQKLLSTIHEDVQLATNPKTGRPLPPSKPRHIIGVLRGESIKKEDGRESNGQKPTHYDYIMDEYIFNSLLEISLREALPYKSWANRIEFFDMTPLKDKEFRDKLMSLIFELHQKTTKHDKHMSKRIYNIFKETMKTRNTDVIKNAFARLEKSGRIATASIYYMYTIDNKYKIITKEQRDRMEQAENIILEESGMTRQYYVGRKKNASIRNEDYYTVQKRISEHLRVFYEAKYYYAAVKVTILDTTIQKEVTEEEKDMAYYSRLFALTDINSKRNKGYGEIHKEWYLLNTYTLLKGFDIPILNVEYNEELEKLKIDQIQAFNFIPEELQNDIDDACDIF